MTLYLRDPNTIDPPPYRRPAKHLKKLYWLLGECWYEKDLIAWIINTIEGLHDHLANAIEGQAKLVHNNSKEGVQ